MREQLVPKSKAKHTNERRYESKDSREIEKGSLSLIALRWYDELVVVGDRRPQYESDFCSMGDGWAYR